MTFRNSMGPASEVLKKMFMDEAHAYILIEYDTNVVTLDSIRETVEKGGANILEITQLEKKDDNIESIVIRLDIQDARPLVVFLSKFPFAKIEAYNSKDYLPGRKV